MLTIRKIFENLRYETEKIYECMLDIGLLEIPKENTQEILAIPDEELGITIIEIPTNDIKRYENSNYYYISEDFQDRIDNRPLLEIITSKLDGVLKKHSLNYVYPAFLIAHEMGHHYYMRTYSNHYFTKRNDLILFNNNVAEYKDKYNHHSNLAIKYKTSFGENSKKYIEQKQKCLEYMYLEALSYRKMSIEINADNFAVEVLNTIDFEKVINDSPFFIYEYNDTFFVTRYKIQNNIPNLKYLSEYDCINDWEEYSINKKEDTLTMKKLQAIRLYNITNNESIDEQKLKSIILNESKRQLNTKTVLIKINSIIGKEDIRDKTE